MVGFAKMSIRSAGRARSGKSSGDLVAERHTHAMGWLYVAVRVRLPVADASGLAIAVVRVYLVVARWLDIVLERCSGDRRGVEGELGTGRRSLGCMG